MTILVVTGTGTGVGKTIATAALAAAARAAGTDVAVCKPVQTGTAPADGPGDDDLAEIQRLAGVTELAQVARYPEPLAPAAAAELAGRPLPSAADVVTSVRAADRPGRLTLVEGLADCWSNSPPGAPPCVTSPPPSRLRCWWSARPVWAPSTTPP